MCRKYHVKHISKQCNLNRLKSGSKRDTPFETSTCAVPMHAPQTNALWRGEEGGTTKTLLYTLPRRVGVEWMWGFAMSLATVGASPGVRPGQAVYSQNRNGYGVQGVVGGRGGSEGMRCWRVMVQAGMTRRQTNSALLRANHRFCHHALREGVPPPRSSTCCR